MAVPEEWGVQHDWGEEMELDLSLATSEAQLLRTSAEDRKEVKYARALPAVFNCGFLTVTLTLTLTRTNIETYHRSAGVLLRTQAGP